MDHPAITRTERTGYPTHIRITHPVRYINTSCECGQWEAIAEWRGQHLCADCLNGIVGVRML